MSVTNDEDSEDFRLVVETGSARLLGEVVITPSVEAEGVQQYEFSIDPPILSTGSCRDDCSLTFKVQQPWFAMKCSTKFLAGFCWNYLLFKKSVLTVDCLGDTQIEMRSQ